nr:ribonuclease H-like domain-containing protein [Tanacetum cinerariifolium]
MIFDGLVKNINNKGASLGTPTEPHHTPSPEAQPSSHTHISSPSLPIVTPISTIPIPTVTLSETTPLRQYTRRARIAQSSALPLVADEPASLVRDVSQGETCPTESGFIADQDKTTIAKSSTLPHDSATRVTSPAAVEDSMQQTINELMDFCICLQRQHFELLARFQAQEVEINKLKERVKLLEDGKGMAAEGSGDDAPIKERRLDKEEVVSTAAAVDPANVSISTGSGVVPTASTTISTATPIFSTATTVTPYTSRKGKEKMVENHTPKKKKKVQEQIDIQDEEIAKIHAEEELQQMIAVWEQIECGVSKISEGEAAWLKRKGIRSEQESAKKQNTTEEVPEEVKSYDEIPEETIKELIRLFSTLMSLLNDKGFSASQSNMAGANQHMTNSIKDMVNLVKVSDLKLTVGHPNGTLAKITHVGNLKLNNDVMLFDVLVIPEYTVSLLSMHKLIKDSKFIVGFDETKCYIQGLKKGRVLETGSEFGGLYLFDKEYNKSTIANNSKFVSCFVSKEVWHCRLGHPANQVLKLLKGSLNLSNIDHEGPCEVCYKAKQTRDSFPLSENKSTVFGQLMHMDVWGPYKVISREGFRYFLTIVDDYS